MGFVRDGLESLDSTDVLTARRWTKRRARRLGWRIASDPHVAAIRMARVGLAHWQITWTLRR
jgi:hypothetical protein